jgi:hypothetical protein
MKPGYTTAQSKYANALNASSGATPKAHAGDREGVGYTPIYIRRKTALRSRELDA